LDKEARTPSRANGSHLHLIAPSNEDSTYIKPLWAATLAAHTPPDVELTFRDDGLDPINLEKESDAPDLVGISVNSKTAARAYAIADAYRKRGSKVVLGGIQVTALPEEGLEHADAVVSGEAEWIWRKVVEDAKAGKLGRGKSLMNRSIYKHEGWPELVNMPLPRRDLVKSIRYVPFDVVQTTRGCPFPCEFCSVSTYNGTTFRFRPVREVVAELETLGNKILFGGDVLVFVDREEIRFRAGPFVDPEPRVLADQPDDARVRGAEDRERGQGLEEAQGAGFAVRALGTAEGRVTRINSLHLSDLRMGAGGGVGGSGEPRLPAPRHEFA
jgi:hypothetical protein